MLRHVFVFVLALLTLSFASANMLMSPSGYVGPGDVQAGAVGFWGVQAYNKAFAAAGSNIEIIRRNSDNALCTAQVGANGIIDQTVGTPCNAGTGCATTPCTVTAFCNATTCYVNSASDHTGGGHTATQATALQQPQHLLSCINSKPCWQFSGNQWLSLPVGSFTQNQPLTIPAVAERTGNFSAEGDVIGGNSSGFDVYFNAANQVKMWAGTGGQGTAAADSVPHSMQFIFNGASSQFYIDGTLTTVASTPGSNGLSNDPNIGVDNAAAPGGPLTGYIGEVGVWGSAFASGTYTPICHNQCSRWGLAACTC